MSNVSIIERRTMIERGKRDIQNGTYIEHTPFRLWDSDTTRNLGTGCLTQQRNVLKRFKELSKGDQEDFARHTEAYRKFSALIPLRQKQHDATFLQPQELDGKPPEIIMQLERMNEAEHGETRRKLQMEISDYEEQLILLTEKISIIQRRILRLQEEFYNLIEIIENKFDELMAIYDAAARRVYHRIKLPTDPPMPTEPPTVSKQRQAGILKTKRGEYLMNEGLFITPLNASQPTMTAMPSSSPDYAQLMAAIDIDEDLDLA
jgi:hypothetical protein